MRKFLRRHLQKFFLAPPQPTTPPSGGSYQTSQYRNILAEWGLPPSIIQARIDAWFDQLFYGDSEKERVYYQVTINNQDMAYILDVNNGDVRSEGMSYGMMIAVQLNKQDEFDKLWTFARTQMYHEDGDWKGYFAWHTQTDGTHIHANPASDGEIWFATALFFAAGRWGNGDGIFNYQQEAQGILNTMLHTSSTLATNMFDSESKLVVFVPQYKNDLYKFTDPSYQAPHYYQLWAQWADQDQDFWMEAAAAARRHWRQAAHPGTGLMSNYADFAGQPKQGTGQDEEYGKVFFCDAWRIGMMIAMDHEWFPAQDHTWQVEQTNRYLQFFHRLGMRRYGSKFQVDGTPCKPEERGRGLIAMNASAAMASSEVVAWDFVEEFWSMELATGEFRYYDGLLMMLALLQTSGNFRIYAPPMSGEANVP